MEGGNPKFDLEDLKNFAALTEARVKGRLELASHSPKPKRAFPKKKRKHHGPGLLSFLAATAAYFAW